MKYHYRSAVKIYFQILIIVNSISSQGFIANPGFEALPHEYDKEYPKSDPSIKINERGCISCLQSWRINHANPAFGSNEMVLPPWNYKYESKVWQYGTESSYSPMLWMFGGENKNKTSRLLNKSFGKSYALIAIWGFDEKGKNRPVNPKSDYFQTKLLRPLEAGKRYKVGFYYTQNKYLYLNNLGVLFTEHSIQLDTVSFINLPAQITIEQIDTSEGMKLFQDTFTATKKFLYLTLGYFPTGKTIHYLKCPDHKPRDYQTMNLSEIDKHPGFWFLVDNINISELIEPDKLQNLLNTKVDCKNIQFETNSSKLKQIAKTELQHLVTLLMEHPLLKIMIEGHTDDVGTDEFNMDLSLRRARKIANYLEINGIIGNRMQISGFGKTKPLLPNSNAANQAINRRVEIKVID